MDSLVWHVRWSSGVDLDLVTVEGWWVVHHLAGVALVDEVFDFSGEEREPEFV